MQWRKIQESPYRLQSRNEQFNVIPLQIFNKILNDSDGTFRINNFEFSELADVLQVTTLLIIDYKSSTHTFSQFLVLEKD
jgi:hypothetical protein